MADISKHYRRRAITKAGKDHFSSSGSNRWHSLCYKHQHLSVIQQGNALMSWGEVV